MQKTWFCVHLCLGNVVLMGIFVFPDPDPDLSGGGGGRSVFAPRPRAPHSAQTLPARPPGVLDPRQSSLHKPEAAAQFRAARHPPAKSLSPCSHRSRPRRLLLMTPEDL